MGRDRASNVKRGEPQTILVVGAGVSGLCAAIFLARRGKKVELWEAAAQPGGLLTPVEFRGIPCDRGSHRLHGESLPTLKEVTRAVDWQTRPRRGTLVLGRRHVDYPLRLGGFLRGLGASQAMRFGLGFLTRKSAFKKFASWEHDRGIDAATNDPGFEHFVRERVGDSAYQAFYRPYAEKVFGLPADEISTVVAKKRVSTAHPLSVLRQALPRALRPFRDAQVPTFEYPRHGMGTLIQALCQEAKTCGVTLCLRQPFVLDQLENPRFEAVVYSAPIAEIFPEPAISHRGLYLLYLAFPIALTSQVDTFYVPEGRYFFGRVSQPRNFSPEFGAQAQANETVLCVEIPEGRWGRDCNFLAQPDTLVEQLHAAGILPKKVPPTAAKQLYLPYVYPLYRRGFFATWRQAMQKIVASGKLFPIGRQGLFLHCNIDHCVTIAADLGAHIASGGTAVEWISHAERYLDFRVRD